MTCDFRGNPDGWQGFGRAARPTCAWVAWRRGVVVALASLSAGCATIGGLTKDSPPEAKQAVVTERAKARWQALIKGDLDPPTRT